MHKSYVLYLRLTALAIGLITGVWSWVVYMMHPSLMAWGVIAGILVESILLLPIIVGIVMWIYMALVTMYPIQHPILLRLSNRGLYLLFPFVILLAKALGRTSDEVSQSLIADRKSVV